MFELPVSELACRSVEVLESWSVGYLAARMRRPLGGGERAAGRAARMGGGDPGAAWGGPRAERHSAPQATRACRGVVSASSQPQCYFYLGDAGAGSCAS